jgi:hypothetical protein
MNWIIGTLLVLFAIAGGSWGWRKGTKDLASPPERHDRPIGVGRREHERRIQKRCRCYANRNVSTISLIAHAHGAFIAARLKRIMT